MSYQELKPSPLLRPYIDAYWVSSQGNTSRILPDGFVDIIFNFGNATTTLPAWGIGVAGMMTKFRDVQINHNSEFIGIRFHPMHFHRWCNIPLHQLKNQTIAINHVQPSWESSFLDQVYQQKDSRGRLALIEQKLIASMSQSLHHRHSLVISVCDTIKACFHSLSLPQVAHHHGISLRQLERLFKTNVGVTMKEYQTIYRFKHTLQNLAQYPDKSLLHIAYDLGYFDHAHLTRTINKMAGILPSQLK